MKISISAIKKICSVVTTGATKSLYDPVESGEAPYHLLPGSAIDQHGSVIISELKPIIIIDEQRCQRFTVQEGDVVILAKGNAIRTAYITKDVAKQNVMVSANCVLLRPNPDYVLGQTIVAYFNTPVGKMELAGLSCGSVIRNISAASIKEFLFPLPSLTQQQQVIKLFHASNDAYQKALQLAEQEKRTVLACISQVFCREEK